MTAPNRIPDARREKIAGAIEEMDRKWTKIARRFGVSASVVKQIAKERGLWISAPPTGETQRAIEAHQQRARETRAVLVPKLLELASVYAEQSRQAAIVYKFGGRDNVFAQEKLPEPDFSGKQALANAIGQLVNAALAIERHDQGEGEDSKGAIISLVDKLREQRTASAG